MKEALNGIYSRHPSLLEGKQSTQSLQCGKWMQYHHQRSAPVLNILLNPLVVGKCPSSLPAPSHHKNYISASTFLSIFAENVQDATSPKCNTEKDSGRVRHHTAGMVHIKSVKRTYKRLWHTCTPNRNWCCRHTAMWDSYYDWRTVWCRVKKSSVR